MSQNNLNRGDVVGIVEELNDAPFNKKKDILIDCVVYDLIATSKWNQILKNFISVGYYRHVVRKHYDTLSNEVIQSIWDDLIAHFSNGSDDSNDDSFTRSQCMIFLNILIKNGYMFYDGVFEQMYQKIS